MEDYFIDREELAQFVDQLVAQKPLDAADEQEATTKREELMRNLDHAIRLGVLNQLTDEQLDEFNLLLTRDIDDTTDDDDGFDDAYEQFFQSAGINLSQVVTDTAQQFAQSYLGGAYA